MRSVLVANAKGGCGKTTISTSLAAAFARAGLVTAIADADRQRGSLNWIERRSCDLPAIRGLDWTKGIGKVKKSLDRLVIDAPAAIEPRDFQGLLKMADVIVPPILPSALDRIAAVAFLGKIAARISRPARPGFARHPGRMGTVDRLRRIGDRYKHPIGRSV